ncbi:hypothetical protein [Pseudoxanthomonas mexicana]
MDTLVDGRGITKVCIAVFVMASALSASPVLAQSKKDVPEDEKHIFMRQFFGKLPSDVPGYTADSKFLASLEQSCAQPPKSTRVASAGGVIFLDWLAKRAVSAANKKLDRYIKEHTVTYSTKPQYGDIGDAGLWTTENNRYFEDPDSYESCVLVTRLSCPAGTGKTKSWGGCRTLLSFAAIMRQDGQSLRVLPIAISIDGLEARHSKGDVAVGVNLEIQAISHSKRGGQRWTSGDITLVSVKFDAKKTNPKKMEYGKDPFFEAYPVSLATWEKAPLLPMPPNLRSSRKNGEPTMGTLKVTVAQVGRPSAFGKRLADLLSTKEDDLAGALGSALKKAAGIEDE